MAAAPLSPPPPPSQKSNCMRLENSKAYLELVYSVQKERESIPWTDFCEKTKHNDVFDKDFTHSFCPKIDGKSVCRFDPTQTPCTHPVHYRCCVDCQKCGDYCFQSYQEMRNRINFMRVEFERVHPLEKFVTYGEKKTKYIADYCDLDATSIRLIAEFCEYYQIFNLKVSDFKRSEASSGGVELGDEAYFRGYLRVCNHCVEKAGGLQYDLPKEPADDC